MTITKFPPTSSSNLAWAYLRRNLEHQKDALHHAAETQTRVERGLFPCFQQTHSDLSAKKWGLLAYSDPTEHKTPFWHPDMSKMTVAAEAQNAGVKTSTPPFIPMLRKANAEIRGLRLFDGRLCLGVASNDTSIQLMFPSGTEFEENTSVTLILPFGLDLPIQAEKAKTLWDVSKGKAKKTPAIASTTS